MNYCGLDFFSTENGEGVRISLFVSGCRIHCPNCFNKDSWDFNYGKPYTEEVESKILKALDDKYIDGITILGGEPLEPENREVLISLVQKVKAMGKTVWLYTGYKHEKVKNYPIMKYIDVLVDSPYIEKLKDTSLLYRGSSNQRIIRFKQI